MKRKYKLAVLAIALLIVARVFAEPYRISGDCMEPAIKDGKLYFLNRIAPHFRQYRIGDIIVFKHEQKIWISRIVALETNTIQIGEGSVAVNGTMIQETNVHRNWNNWKLGTHAIDKPLQVPAGHVFVLSDNLSSQHDDSRVFGPISQESIVGLIW